MLDTIWSVLPYALIASAVLVGVLLTVGAFLKKRSPKEEEAPVSVAREVESKEPVHPKCVCGALATHPSPKLVRSRTGWLRSFFGISPLYRRVVPSTDSVQDLVFCETHAHVADSMMDRFIYEEVRAVLAEANEAISVKAAAFEREKLIAQIEATVAPKKKATVADSGVIEFPKLFASGQD